jgi:hypothetical protein
MQDTALAPALPGDVQTLVARALEQEQRNGMLSWQVAGLRERLDAHQAALVHERRALASAEAEARSLSERYVELQAQNGNLAKLVIAATLLHASLDGAAVVQAIQEVVINLIGSEEFAVVEVEGGRLRVLATFGMDPDRARTLPLRGELAGALHTGEPVLHEDVTSDHEHPIAVLPLRTGEHCGAAVVIFGLLTQKEGWVPFDHELFSLLRTHAGAALYTARLHRERRP